MERRKTASVWYWCGCCEIDRVCPGQEKEGKDQMGRVSFIPRLWRNWAAGERTRTDTFEYSQMDRGFMVLDRVGGVGVECAWRRKTLVVGTGPDWNVVRAGLGWVLHFAISSLG